ncbi:MAG: hypothetical protein L3J09_06600 [Flavobacteriaceae bacterium]|nr:hypothetical protein [Flavobacteriaceae bacterium]
MKLNVSTYIYKINFLITLLIAVIIVSCSSEEKEIDSSFITDYSWRLESLIVPIAIDLNLDGTASLDMTDEFDCIKDENFYFNSNGDVWYSGSNLLLIKTYGGGTITERYECSEEPVDLFLRWGTFRMIDENNIEIIIEEFSTFPGFVLEYHFNNNKLTQTISSNYPISYNEDTNTYNREIIEIKKVFIHN